MFCPKCGQENINSDQFCLKCGKQLNKPSGSDTSRLKQKFPNLSSNIYEHPDDTKALKTMEKIPFMGEIINQVFKHWHNLNYEVTLTGNSVKVTEKQFPEIYDIFTECGEILNAGKMPKIYITQDPNVYANTTGVEDTFLVISSGLIDIMNKEELYFIIGHELGHIKSNHILYYDVANWIKNLSSTVGNFTFGVGEVVGMGLMTALVSWIKKSELTADRAGLLACQDIDIAIKALIKMALGSRKLFSQISIEEYLRQGEELEEDEDKSTVYKAIKMMQDASHSQPFTTRRVKHLKEWHNSKAYKIIIDGDYLDSYDTNNENLEDLEEVECPVCRTKLSYNDTICPLCNHKIFKAPPICPECFKDLKPHWTKCPHCKKTLSPSKTHIWFEKKYNKVKELLETKYERYRRR